MLIGSTSTTKDGEQSRLSLPLFPASRVRSFPQGTFHETSPHGEKRGGTNVFSGYDEQNEENNICPIQRRGRLNGLKFSRREMHRLCC